MCRVCVGCVRGQKDPSHRSSPDKHRDSGRRCEGWGKKRKLLIEIRHIPVYVQVASLNLSQSDNCCFRLLELSHCFAYVAANEGRVTHYITLTFYHHIVALYVIVKAYSCCQMLWIVEKDNI